MTALERIMSDHPVNSFGDNGIDYSHSGQATVSPIYSAAPHRYRITSKKSLPNFTHSPEWDAFEVDIPDY